MQISEGTRQQINDAKSLADELSISNHVMSKIIKGTKAINARELKKIASVLGTTRDSLLMANIESVQIESIAFMRTMQDEKIREKVEMLRLNIDEILRLEERSHGLNITPARSSRRLSLIIKLLMPNMMPIKPE